MSVGGIARRLRDPLQELIRVEPRGLGLGQNLTEVHQGLLKRQLDAAASSCLARIGIDSIAGGVRLRLEPRPEADLGDGVLPAVPGSAPVELPAADNPGESALPEALEAPAADAADGVTNE